MNTLWNTYLKNKIHPHAFAKIKSERYIHTQLIALLFILFNNSHYAFAKIKYTLNITRHTMASFPLFGKQQKQGVNTPLFSTFQHWCVLSTHGFSSNNALQTIATPFFCKNIESQTISTAYLLSNIYMQTISTIYFFNSITMQTSVTDYLLKNNLSQTIAEVCFLNNKKSQTIS